MSSARVAHDPSGRDYAATSENIPRIMRFHFASVVLGILLIVSIMGVLAMPIFGVRGLNSGLDDADNLAWKLAAVLQGARPAGVTAQQWFNRLTEQAGAHFLALSGGRGLFRLPAGKVDSVRATFAETA